MFTSHREELQEAKKEIKSLEVKLANVVEEYNKKQAEFIRVKELEHKEKIQELNTVHNKVVAELKLTHGEAIIEIKQKLMEDYMIKLNESNTKNYEKLSDSLAKLHEEGNANTKTIKEFALKAMETSRPVYKAIGNK